MSAGNGHWRPLAKPKAIDVFSGCGGTVEGLRGAGFRVLAAIEMDELAVKTFRANHKGVKVWHTDIADLTAKSLLEHHGLRRGELDLLTGCPPCQAFSALRRLNGSRRVRDKASKDLVFQYLKLVRALYPKVVLIENVPRLLNDYRFNEVRKRLRALGYVGQPQIFDAADFGVPQRRRRMIFVASRIGKIEYAAPSDPKKKTVREAIGALPKAGKSGDPLHDFAENRSTKVAALIAKIPKNGGSRLALGKRRQLACHKECDGFKDVYGRMAWNQVSPTITSGCVNPSKGRFLHPSQNRSITLREAALLQGFPPHYSFALDRGKFAVALMIGNAFPPTLVKPHARKIRLHIGAVNRKRRRKRST
jgi:DNA (cytosine-5)-methyltransferase 1